MSSTHSYPISYALNKYLESMLLDPNYGNFDRKKVFVLSLDEEKSTFNSLKMEIVKALGKDALKKKSGTFHYFILFKQMDKNEILEKLQDFPDIGSTWNEEEVVEYDRNGTKYYITKFEFEDN